MKTKEFIKTAAGWFVLICFCIIAALVLYKCGQKRASQNRGQIIREIVTETITDTVRYNEPVLANSITAGSRYYNIPASCVRRASADTTAFALQEDCGSNGDSLYFGAGAGGIPQHCGDSLTVGLPMIQRHYKDSTYEAWVSGPVDPRLDSISIYKTRELTLVTERVYKPPNHWHIGITAGCGYTPGGFQPYIGIGITYSIISF